MLEVLFLIVMLITILREYRFSSESKALTYMFEILFLQLCKWLLSRISERIESLPKTYIVS